MRSGLGGTGVNIARLMRACFDAQHRNTNSHLLVFVPLVHEEDGCVVSRVSDGTPNRLVHRPHADAAVVLAPCPPAADKRNDGAKRGHGGDQSNNASLFKTSGTGTHNGRRERRTED